MMNYLVGGGTELLWDAVKALLLFATAVVGLRVSRRRTLSQMSPFDFVTAVAVGAIVGRVPNAPDSSYLSGAITLAVILLAHALITRLRFSPVVARLVDHPPRLLVTDGQVLDYQLRRSGLTRHDLNALLRQQGVTDLHDVRYVIFEQRGRISVVRHQEDGRLDLVDELPLSA